MRPIYLIASGGILAAASAAVLGYRKAAETKNGVLAATGGDAQAAVSASSKAKAAKSPADVQAAASQAQAAANAAPPSSPDVIAEADKAVSAARSAKTTDEVKVAADKVQTVAAKMTGNSSISLRLTEYYPFTAADSEKKMEGGVHDRKGNPLHTVEDFFSGKSDHVSLSGDDKAWPYGQKVTIPWPDGRTVVGRVTDTGGSFRGLGKRYRIAGDEPVDVCVFARTTRIPKEAVGQIVRGDHLDKAGKDVAVTRFKGQEVVGSLHMLGAC